jgi:hypothetical protein
VPDATFACPDLTTFCRLDELGLVVFGQRLERTGSDLLTDRQRQRLTAVFATEQHVEVEATWGVYQRIVAANRNHDRAAANTELKGIIATITAAVPRRSPS